MDCPRISIVTPSFNQGKFIRQTIDSVLGQNYPNLEYIIMDGGSTDNTHEILQSYGNKINWVSEKDQGQADAINKGMFRASGEILAYINSDDCYLPNIFNLVARKFSLTGCKWLTGDYSIIDQDSQEIQGFVVKYKIFWRKFSSSRVLSLLNYIAQPSTFWHRDIWNLIGPYDIDLQYAMDYDFWLRAFKIESPLILNQTLSRFRIHKTSKGSSQFQNQFDEEINVLRRYNNNYLIDWLHQCHNYLNKQIYKMIK